MWDGYVIGNSPKTLASVCVNIWSRKDTGMTPNLGIISVYTFLKCTGLIDYLLRWNSSKVLPTWLLEQLSLKRRLFRTFKVYFIDPVIMDKGENIFENIKCSQNS
jgi:hypothetical protein